MSKSLPLVGLDPPLRGAPAVLCRHCRLEIAAVCKLGDEYTGWIHAESGILRCDLPSPSAWPYDGWRNGHGGGALRQPPDHEAEIR